MGNLDSTAYVRFSFDVADKDQLTALQLDLRFDDGFIAYLNGREVARANFAEDFIRPQPQWDSLAGNQLGTNTSASAANRVNESDDVATFDLTPYLPSLVEGTNVLAFHGVNSRSTASGGTNQQDFLIEPVLSAERAVGTLVGYIATPTPGADNALATLGFVGDTHFSVDRGFFDSPFQVEITTDILDAEIRYTLDGSAPSETHGTLYTGPITIDTTTVLRAVGFKTDFAPTNVDTQTYIFLDDVLGQDASYVTQPYATWGHDKEDEDNLSGYNLDDESDWEMDPEIVTGNEAAVKDALLALPTMSIVMDWDDLFSGEPLPGTFPAGSAVAPSPEGIYIHGTSIERFASLEYFNPENFGDQFHLDVGIELQGHSSTLRWNSDKMSFQVKFKFPYGPTELNYPFFLGTPDGGTATTTFDTLILDAMFNYAWHHNNPAQRNFARFVTDQVVSDLQNQASGIGAPHGKYVHLYLNGLYWGLYNVHERPDDSFADQYYGGRKDDYYVVKHANQDVNHEFTWVEGGVAAEQAYVALLEASRAVADDPSSLAKYQDVENVLDVDQFLDYMIVHMYAGNRSDWPHNNWYATFNHADPNGKWRFHAWDQEHAFPTNDNGDSFTQFVDLTEYADEDFESSFELFYNLIVNEEFRLRFADRVQELMYDGGPLTEAAAQATYEARVAEIEQALVAESARWGDNRVPDDPYTQADFITTTNNLLSAFFPVRTSTVLAQFNSTYENSEEDLPDKIDWIPALAAPLFSQYGGQVTAGYDLVLTKPGGSPGGAAIYYTLDGSDPRMAGGGTSPSAVAYGAAIDLAESTQVKARIFFDTAGTADDWSPLVDKTFFVDAQEVYPLRIVELMYNLPGSDDAEYIELLNTGNDSIDLADVQITEFSTGGYSFTGGTLAAGERIVVVANQAAFAAAYPGASNVAPGEFSGSLANEGESVALRGPLGELIQFFTYDDNAPWPTTPDGGGYSLVYVGPFDQDAADPSDVAGDPYDDPMNWAASAAIGGSPGAAEPTLTFVPGDYDRNGTVESADYTKWKADFGMVVEPGSGSDGNGNGAVDAADYTVWRDHLGQTNDSGSGAAAVATVVDVASPRPLVVAATSEPVTPAKLRSSAFAALALPDASPQLSPPISIAARDASHADRMTPRSDGAVLWDFVWRSSRGTTRHDDADRPRPRRAADDSESSSRYDSLWEDDAWIAQLGPARISRPLVD
jgi:hypothetical protein